MSIVRTETNIFLKAFRASKFIESLNNVVEYIDVGLKSENTFICFIDNDNKTQHVNIVDIERCKSLGLKPQQIIRG